MCNIAGRAAIRLVRATTIGAKISLHFEELSLSRIDKSRGQNFNPLANECSPDSPSDGASNDSPNSWMAKAKSMRQKRYYLLPFTKFEIPGNTG